MLLLPSLSILLGYSQYVLHRCQRTDVACSVWVAIFFNTRNDGDVDYIVRVAIQ
jgi:hypothetical protein